MQGLKEDNLKNTLSWTLTRLSFRKSHRRWSAMSRQMGKEIRFTPKTVHPGRSMTTRVMSTYVNPGFINHQNQCWLWESWSLMGPPNSDSVRLHWYPPNESIHPGLTLIPWHLHCLGSPASGHDSTLEMAYIAIPCENPPVLRGISLLE